MLTDSIKNFSQNTAILTQRNLQISKRNFGFSILCFNQFSWLIFFWRERSERRLFPKQTHSLSFWKNVIIVLNNLEDYVWARAKRASIFFKVKTHSLSFWKNLIIVLNNLEDCFQRIERFQKLPCHCKERSNQGWIQKLKFLKTG